MKREILFTISSLYRDPMHVTGFRFGVGEKSAAIVGALRGNEVQQLYVCSQIVRALTYLESQDRLVPGHEVLVVPSVNHYSMNLGKRFWALDNTDINRMFPGYNLGETTQRIAAALFEHLRGYRFGMQFASFYMHGDFLPHVKMMDTGYQTPETGLAFGLPYVIMRTPRPYDTTTLNYNWQVWDTTAFSVYTSATEKVDAQSAQQAVSAVLRFLHAQGILRCPESQLGALESTVVYESSLRAISTPCAGIYHRAFAPGHRVSAGQILCEITDPLEGGVAARIPSPINGTVFFAHESPLVNEKDVVYRVIAQDERS